MLKKILFGTALFALISLSYSCSPPEYLAIGTVQDSNGAILDNVFIHKAHDEDFNTFSDSVGHFELWWYPEDLDDEYVILVFEKEGYETRTAKMKNGEERPVLMILDKGPLAEARADLEERLYR